MISDVEEDNNLMLTRPVFFKVFKRVPWWSFRVSAPFSF